MAKFEEVLAPGLTIRESANDGSDFTNPTADYRRLFLGEDGELHTKDSAGSVAGFAGTGIQTTLADAAGDMLVASAADTWAKLATPTVNGQALQRVSGSPAWALPPGYEFDYVQITGSGNITATSDATANTIMTANAVTYDGSTIVIIETNITFVTQGTTFITIVLYDGSTCIGRIAITGVRAPIYMRHRLTPSAAAHTYSVRAFVDAGTGTYNSGAGGTAAYMPSFIRQTKA